MSTATLAPFTLRPAAERGHGQHGSWLDSRFSFSFADYFDPQHMGHSVLRVINDDRIAPHRGFGAHPHQDMEIVTVVLSGAVAHKDSTGGESVLRANEVQRMTAGKGIVHSEMNPESESLHLLQLWILPESQGLPPSYEQKLFPKHERLGKFQVVVAPGGPNGALHIHQDMRLMRVALNAEHPTASHHLALARKAWLQVATGSICLNGQALQAGDGARFDQGGGVALEWMGEQEAELLFFDLP